MSRTISDYYVNTIYLYIIFCVVQVLTPLALLKTWFALAREIASQYWLCCPVITGPSPEPIPGGLVVASTTIGGDGWMIQY